MRVFKAMFHSVNRWRNEVFCKIQLTSDILPCSVKYRYKKSAGGKAVRKRVYNRSNDDRSFIKTVQLAVFYNTTIVTVYSTIH